ILGLCDLLFQLLQSFLDRFEFEQAMSRGVSRYGGSIQCTTGTVGVSLVDSLPDHLLVQFLKQRPHAIAELVERGLRRLHAIDQPLVPPCLPSSPWTTVRAAVVPPSARKAPA